MTNKHTYCFKYRTIFFEICFAWFEAPCVEAAKEIFEEECDDCFKLESVTETFNW